MMILVSLYISDRIQYVGIRNGKIGFLKGTNIILEALKKCRCFVAEITDMKVFEGDVYARAVLKNENDNKLFKVIHLEETDYTWFELIWGIPIKREFSYGDGYLYGIEAYTDKLYKYNPRCKVAKRGESLKVWEDAHEVQFVNGGTLWALRANKNILKKDMNSENAGWEKFDGIECHRNIRDASNYKIDMYNFTN